MGRGRGLGAAWTVLLVVVAGCSATAAPSDASPEDVLREIRTFVAAHPTARFESTSAPAGPSGEQRITGELDGERVVVRTAWAQGIGESITEDGTIWSRFTPAGADPERWVRSTPEDREPPPARSGATVGVMVGVSFSIPETGSLADLVAILEDAEAWTAIDDGAIRTSRPARELLAADDLAELERLAERVDRANIDEVLDTVHTVTVEHGPGGRLDAISDETGGRRSTTRFRDWGADLRIDLPPEGEVDSVAERRASALAG